MKLNRLFLALLLMGFAGLGGFQGGELLGQDRSSLAEQVARPADAGSLVGKWYAGGDPNQVCYVTAGGGKLFAINNGFSTYELIETEGQIFAAQSTRDPLLSMAVRGDLILWSNNSWWSRKPIIFGNPSAP